MKRSIRIVVLLTALFVARGAVAQEASTEPVPGGPGPQITARSPQTGFVYVPASSQPQPGSFAHTNYVLRSADGRKPAGVPAPSAFAFGGTLTAVAAENGTVPLSQQAETPASMGCLYVGSPLTEGCIPNYSAGSGGPSVGGYGAIALVDAYDNPTAATDLATFDTYWGLLAPPSFTKVYANGNGDCTTPPPNPGWALEKSLDIEWAHVFAPQAAIILVEACSNSNTDLLYAEQVAFEYIETNFKGGGQVSNSWQGGEFSGQISDDVYSQTPLTITLTLTPGTRTSSPSPLLGTVVTRVPPRGIPVAIPGWFPRAAPRWSAPTATSTPSIAGPAPVAEPANTRRIPVVSPGATSDRGLTSSIRSLANPIAARLTCLSTPIRQVASMSTRPTAPGVGS